MKDSERISELLVETGAYKDLDSPVILTSGELGIYYVNTEKLLQDEGKWVDHGDDSRKMISYVKGLLSTKSGFKEVIEIMSKDTELRLLDKKGQYKKVSISGGQRRDWLFSGPVAYSLGLDHISLYKQTEDIDKFEVLNPEGKILSDHDLGGRYAFHIVDLITEGSSIYSLNRLEPKGWVPMLRNAGVAIDSLLSVVTRHQGGEERLLEQGVNVNSFVSIYNDFLRKYSKDPERALAYSKDPSEWSRNYIEKHGAMMFIDVFDPNGGKLERGLKFLLRYKKVLAGLGKLKELEDAIKTKFDLELKSEY
jgi:orotate phosphoribosyltransferase